MSAPGCTPGIGPIQNSLRSRLVMRAICSLPLIALEGFMLGHGLAEDEAGGSGMSVDDVHRAGPF